jgi:hypothetical protein
VEDWAAWPREVRRNYHNDWCIATRNAVRRADDVERVDAAVTAIEAAAAAAAAAGDTVARVNAFRVMRKVARDWMDQPGGSAHNLQRLRRLLERAEWEIRDMGYAPEVMVNGQSSGADAVSFAADNAEKAAKDMVRPRSLPLLIPPTKIISKERIPQLHFTVLFYEYCAAATWRRRTRRARTRRP